MWENFGRENIDESTNWRVKYWQTAFYSPNSPLFSHAIFFSHTVLHTYTIRPIHIYIYALGMGDTSTKISIPILYVLDT